LNHSGTNATRSRAILNKLIILLMKIIINKKKLSTNTVSFLNQRISDFSKEKVPSDCQRRYLQTNILVLETYIADKTKIKR
jgi:hypothetical protein